MILSLTDKYFSYNKAKALTSMGTLRGWPPLLLQRNEDRRFLVYERLQAIKPKDASMPVKEI